jgi:hypothetical protein
MPAPLLLSYMPVLEFSSVQLEYPVSKASQNPQKRGRVDQIMEDLYASNFEMILPWEF